MHHRGVNVTEGAFQQIGAADGVGAGGVVQQIYGAGRFVDRVGYGQAGLPDFLGRVGVVGLYRLPHRAYRVQHIGAGAADDSFGLAYGMLHRGAVAQEGRVHCGGVGAGQLQESIHCAAGDAQGVGGQQGKSGCHRGAQRA